MAPLSRRQLIAGMAASAAVLSTDALATPKNPLVSLDAQLRALETTEQDRIGAALMNCATGAITSHRGNERFLVNSTNKFFVAAAVLARIDSGKETPSRRIEVQASDLGGWTPVTEQHLGAPGMTIAELCQAAVSWSDNAAANVLIRSVGGPAAVTDYLRSIGDETTRLDRYEPALNEHDHAGDERDTTTPLAMMQTVRTLLLGDALSAASRHQLAAWMIQGKTGDARLRAGMPASWLIGEKTGTNGVGNANDIGIALPGDRGAVIAVAYTYLPNAEKSRRDTVIAEIGRLAGLV